jgi:hypothetical protein
LGAEGHEALEVRMRQDSQQYNLLVARQCVEEADVDRLWGDELMPWIHSEVAKNISASKSNFFGYPLSRTQNHLTID